LIHTAIFILSDVKPSPLDPPPSRVGSRSIFEEGDGKMNRSVADVGGAVLAISQFALYGDVRRGKRPSFEGAARPERARELYDYFVAQIRQRGVRYKTG
jgi:D-aminoacyl-tRNA deacylase